MNALPLPPDAAELEARHQVLEQAHAAAERAAWDAMLDEAYLWNAVVDSGHRLKDVAHAHGLRLQLAARRAQRGEVRP